MHFSSILLLYRRIYNIHPEHTNLHTFESKNYYPGPRLKSCDYVHVTHLDHPSGQWLISKLEIFSTPHSPQTAVDDSVGWCHLIDK